MNSGATPLHTPSQAGEASVSPARKERRRQANAQLRRRRRIITSVAAPLVLAAGVTVWGVTTWAGSTNEVETAVVSGVEFSSELTIADEPSGVYLYVPVNTDWAEVTLETDDPTFTEELRSELQSLDTFVPGEHVLTFPQMTIHVIIDGLDGHAENPS